jgi:hypothetical protein
MTGADARAGAGASARSRLLLFPKVFFWPFANKSQTSAPVKHEVSARGLRGAGHWCHRPWGGLGKKRATSPSPLGP